MLLSATALVAVASDFDEVELGAFVAVLGAKEVSEAEEAETMPPEGIPFRVHPTGYNVVPFAAVTDTQLKVHCASPADGDDSQHQVLSLTPTGGTLARSSLQFPGIGAPLLTSQRKMMLFLVNPVVGVSQKAVSALVHVFGT